LDIHKLKGFVEDVELFKDGFTAEVVRLSKYKWHYVDETYVLHRIIYLPAECGWPLCGRPLVASIGLRYAALFSVVG